MKYLIAFISTIFFLAFIVCVLMVNSKDVYACSDLYEPNDYQSCIQELDEKDNLRHWDKHPQEGL